MIFDNRKSGKWTLMKEKMKQAIDKLPSDTYILFNSKQLEDHNNKIIAQKKGNELKQLNGYFCPRCKRATVWYYYEKDEVIYIDKKGVSKFEIGTEPLFTCCPRCQITKGNDLMLIISSDVESEKE
jgi:hypothetical protein